MGRQSKSIVRSTKYWFNYLSSWERQTEGPTLSQVISPAGAFCCQTHRRKCRCWCCEVPGRSRSRSVTAWTAPSFFPCRLEQRLEIRIFHFLSFLSVLLLIGMGILASCRMSVARDITPLFLKIEMDGRWKQLPCACSLLQRTLITR